ncbi:hypothetical protein BS47DRAFT_1488683 [Hydnum rufescens UP504]|uniref:DH domain-containing protein n=1 Tax=Hydnum rufescens UP504 TaxID=1448309 RepID=A0A9P6DRN3_9AGAM|nr:hypothetical protein BS47DRAFT_1488683 [Hydnum rufescens UP504]
MGAISSRTISVACPGRHPGLTAATSTTLGGPPSRMFQSSSSPPSPSAIKNPMSPLNSPHSSLPNSLSNLSMNESHSVSSGRPSATSSITSVLSTSLPLSHNTTKTLPRVPSDYSLGLQLMSPASLDREPIAPMAKRKHALLELLSSERVYANDLALMRHIHIPMALGHSPHFQPPDSPSAEVDGPPSTRSTSSRSALSSSTPLIFKDEAINKPPMTAEDVRVIFSNTEDLAVFADVFAERIEVALGDTLDVADDSSPGISDADSRVDAVGELFLEVAPTLKQLYTTYITRHPLALSRLTMLTALGPGPEKASTSNSFTDPKGSGHGESRIPGITPEMQFYLAKTRALTQRHTHAWDLPSLLIKASENLRYAAEIFHYLRLIQFHQPVQRLLKYPLLIQSIIQPTQAFNPDHPDLPYLIKAKDVLEVIARDVNESRRRWEVVKAVLEGYGFGPPVFRLAPPVRSPSSSVSINAKAFSFARNFGGGKTTKRSKSAGSGAPPPNAFGHRSKHSPRPPGDEIAPNPLTRIQSLKTKLKTNFATFTPPPGAAEEASATVAELTAWEARLRQSEVVLRDFFRILIVEWSRSVQDVFIALRGWGIRFGHVIEDPVRDAKSDDAIKSFVELVDSLMVLWTDLNGSLQSMLQPILTSLLETLARPLTLVQHAIALHPLHLQHLSTPYVKNRSPYLVSSSKTFLALHAQLRIEMPSYLALFDRGFAGIVIKASKLQARFWEECWTRWSLFAIGVGVNGEGMRLPPNMAPVPDEGTSDSGPPPHSSGFNSSNPTIFPSPEIFLENDEPEVLWHFRRRWEPVNHVIGELMIVQPRLLRPRESDPSVIDIRSSVTSSLLASVSSEMLNSMTTSTSSPSSPHTRPRTPERGTASSPQSTRSPQITRGRSGTTSSQPSETSNTPFETPTSVNAPPKPPTENRKVGHKKSGRVEVAPNVSAQPHSKAEKGLEKQRGKVKSKGSSSSVMSGVFFSGLMGGSLLSPGLPPPTEGTTGYASLTKGQEVDDEAAHRRSRRRSDREEERRRQREAEAHSVPQRTNDEFFDLIPLHSTDASAPTLPTLEQMSPLSISPRSFLADSPSRVRHPYTFASHPPSPSSPQSGELGMWESLFDASRQSYLFHSHGRVHSEHSLPPLRPLAFTGTDVQTHFSGSASHDNAPVNTLELRPVYNSPSLQYADPEPPTPEHETLYVVSCVHPFHPPNGAMHLGLSFLTLDVGDVVDILLEDGHPSTHEGLPISIDDGDDCMLVGRDERDNIGWCLASFVMPLI